MTGLMRCRRRRTNSLQCIRQMRIRRHWMMICSGRSMRWYSKCRVSWMRTRGWCIWRIVRFSNWSICCLSPRWRTHTSVRRLSNLRDQPTKPQLVQPSSTWSTPSPWLLLIILLTNSPWAYLRGHPMIGHLHQWKGAAVSTARIGSVQIAWVQHSITIRVHRSHKLWIGIVEKQRSKGWNRISQAGPPLHILSVRPWTAPESVIRTVHLNRV